MPRKKAEGTGTPVVQKTEREPVIVRYLTTTMTLMGRYITERDHAAAEQLRAEIEETIDDAFGGVARATLRALISREWKLAQDLASTRIDGVDWRDYEPDIMLTGQEFSLSDDEPEKPSEPAQDPRPEI